LQKSQYLEAILAWTSRIICCLHRLQSRGGVGRPSALSGRLYITAFCPWHGCTQHDRPPI